MNYKLSAKPDAPRRGIQITILKPIKGLLVAKWRITMKLTMGDPLIPHATLNKEIWF